MFFENWTPEQFAEFQAYYEQHGHEHGFDSRDTYDVDDASAPASAPAPAPVLYIPAEESDAEISDAEDVVDLTDSQILRVQVWQNPRPLPSGHRLNPIEIKDSPLEASGIEASRIAKQKASDKEKSKKRAKQFDRALGLLDISSTFFNGFNPSKSRRG